jgi:hypothetical protein
VEVGGTVVTPVIPALGRLRREDREFEASVSYRAGPCLKIYKKTTYW